MADYILSCCSTADLSKEHFDSREIHYICFHFMLDGVDYPDDLGVSVPGGFATTAGTRTSPSTWSRSETGCASVPARRWRSTA